MTVQEVAETYHTSATTVQNVRAGYAEKGLEATITRKKRETPPVAAKVTGDVEAKIIALACTQPPEGYSRWTVRLLADKVVELSILPEISYVTVQRTLKKRISSSPEAYMVHTTAPERRFCCQYGRCAQGIFTAL